MDLKEVERVVGKIQSSLFKNSNNYSVGMLKSHFRGSGLQFREHQVYTHGDDVRFIDWKLSAKTSIAYIKTFEEERNVEITVILDATRSMMLGFEGVSKLQAAVEITCLLYLLAHESHDKIKVVVLADKVYSLPPKDGRAGIILLVNLLEKLEILNSSGKINIHKRFPEEISEASKVQALKAQTGKKREVVILSDFHHFLAIKDLEKVFIKKNLHCFRILSPLDEENKMSFSIFASESSRSSMKNNLVNCFTKDEQQVSLQKLFKIKKLFVSERYLEKFIREML